MGLVSSRVSRTGRPGRQPLTYRISPKGRRYLTWLRGPALFQGFRQLVVAGVGEISIGRGKELLQRLRTFEGDGIDTSTLGLLESQLGLTELSRTPEDCGTLWTEMAGACMEALRGAPLKIDREAHALFGPYLLGVLKPKLGVVPAADHSRGGPDDAAAAQFLAQVRTYLSGFNAGYKKGLGEHGSGKEPDKATSSKQN